MYKSSFTVKILSGVLIIIALMVFRPLASIGLDEMPKFKDYVSSGNYFKCSIPAEWSVYDPGFGLSEEEKKVYGVVITSSSLPTPNAMRQRMSASVPFAHETAAGTPA